MPYVPYDSLSIAGHEIRWFQELESTNDYIVNLAKNIGTEIDRDRLAGLVAVSDYQSKGRGRMSREWLAPPGRCLLMSILIPAATIPDDPFLVVSATALAAAEACMETARLHVDIAWPNDLYVEGRKLGGILTEIVGGTSQLVVGLGLNVTWPTIAEDGIIVDRSISSKSENNGQGNTSTKASASVMSDPPEGESMRHSPNTATSILLESGRLVDRRYLLERLLAGLDRHLEEATMPSGIADMVKEYRERCITIGKRVSIALAGGRTVQGIAVAVDSNGRLSVEGEPGIEVFTAGDVRIIR
jgi:BirA family biotin operon repressor/biotin-[acetyl-CoA-carboxylase] ligase